MALKDDPYVSSPAQAQLIVSDVGDAHVIGFWLHRVSGRERGFLAVKEPLPIPAEVLVAIADFLSRCQTEATPFAANEAIGAVRTMFPGLAISDADLAAAIFSEASRAGFDVRSTFDAPKDLPAGQVVSLFADKRWKAVLDYRTSSGTMSVEHYFEEIADLHLIVEHGPDWNGLVRCTVTLNRPDKGTEQNSVEKARRRERSL